MSEETVQPSVPPLEGVVQSPDGSMQYYRATSIKNKHNPYLYQTVLTDVESNTNSSDNYVEVECNGETILILESDFNRAVKLEWNANMVRCICMLDFIINLFVALGTYYTEISRIILYILALISITGYCSTFTYSRSGLILYLVYQYMQSFNKIVLSGVYLAASSNKFKEQLENYKIVYLNITPENIILLLIATLGQIYITCFVQRFYNLLPTRRARPRARPSTFAH